MRIAIIFVNPFIRAAGVAAIAYVIFRVLSPALFALAQIIQSFAYWVKWNRVPWSEELAIGLGVAWSDFHALLQPVAIGIDAHSIS